MLQRLLFALNICVLISFLLFNTACSSIASLDIKDNNDKISIYGSSLWEWGDAVAAGTDGSIYVCGRVENLEINRYDALILKYDKNGNVLWQKTWGGNDGDWALGVAVGSNNNIYVVGYTYSFGEGAGDGFIVKYDSDGKLLWQKTIGGECPDQLNAIAVDRRDNIYVAGRTNSWGAGDDDAFIAKLNPDGKIMWQRTWGGEDWDSASAIVVTHADDILVAGATMSFGNGKTDADVVLLKYTNFGRLESQKIWGGVNWEEAVAISCVPLIPEASADLRLFTSNVLNKVLRYTDDADTYFLKGLEEWKHAQDHKQKIVVLSALIKAKEYYISAQNALKRLDKVNDETKEIKLQIKTAIANDITSVDIITELLRQKIKDVSQATEEIEQKTQKAVDIKISADNGLLNVSKRICKLIESLPPVGSVIYLAGSTQSDNSYDTFLLKYNVDGGLRWQKSWGGARTDWAKAMAVMPDETIYLAGRSDSFIQDGYDAFLVKYNSNGDLVEQKTWGGQEWDCFDAMALGQANEIYVAGGTENIGGNWQDVKGDDITLTAKSQETSGIDTLSGLILQDAQGVENTITMKYILDKPSERNWNVLFIRHNK